MSVHNSFPYAPPPPPIPPLIVGAELNPIKSVDKVFLDALLIVVGEKPGGRPPCARSVRRMMFQHPLAYMLGLEGVALMRAFAGEHGEEFVSARVREVRELLESADLFGEGCSIRPISTIDGYRTWAATYDEPGNGLIDVEEPIVHGIIEGLPPGIAFDVAC